MRLRIQPKRATSKRGPSTLGPLQSLPERSTSLASPLPPNTQSHLPGRGRQANLARGRSRSSIIKHESPTHPAPSRRATQRPGAPSWDHWPPPHTVRALRSGEGQRVGCGCLEDPGWSLEHADKRHPARAVGGGAGRTMGQVRGRGAAGKGGGKVAARWGIGDPGSRCTHSRFFWSAPPQLQASTCCWISPCSAAAAPAPRAGPARGAQRERLGRAGVRGGRQAGLGRDGAAPLSGRARASRARGSGALRDRG